MEQSLFYGYRRISSYMMLELVQAAEGRVYDGDAQSPFQGRPAYFVISRPAASKAVLHILQDAGLKIPGVNRFDNGEVWLIATHHSGAKLARIAGRRLLK